MIWKHIKHFTPHENWGDHTKVNGLLLLLMDAIRHLWGMRFVIHCACDLSGHSTKSYHYTGDANDFHIKDVVPFYFQTEQMERTLEDLQVADRVGLGIYPDWHNPGFHLDVRGVRARWGRIGDKYVGFEEAKEYARKKGI